MKVQTIASVLSSYMTLIGVHEMHGRVHPNQCHVTDLLVVDLCSLLAYFMTTHPLPVASKLPIKTRQLPTNSCNIASAKCFPQLLPIGQ